MHTVTLTLQIRRPRKTNAVYLAKQPSHPALSLGECFLLYRRAGFFFRALFTIISQMPHVAEDVTLIAVRMSLNTNAACLLPCVEFCLKTL